MEVRTLVAVDGATHLKLLIDWPEILKRSFFLCLDNILVFYLFPFRIFGIFTSLCVCVCCSLAFSTIIYIEKYTSLQRNSSKQ